MPWNAQRHSTSNLMFVPFTCPSPVVPNLWFIAKLRNGGNFFCPLEFRAYSPYQWHVCSNVCINAVSKVMTRRFWFVKKSLFFAVSLQGSIWWLKGYDTTFRADSWVGTSAPLHLQSQNFHTVLSMRWFGSHVKLSVITIIISSSSSRRRRRRRRRILWALKIKIKIPTPAIAEFTMPICTKNTRGGIKQCYRTVLTCTPGPFRATGPTKQSPRAIKFRGNSHEVGIKYSTVTNVLHRSDKTICFYDWHVHSIHYVWNHRTVKHFAPLVKWLGSQKRQWAASPSFA